MVEQFLEYGAGITTFEERLAELWSTFRAKRLAL